MEKEQKKLLLVAVSVGVFLLVTVTVAIIILTPRTQTPAAAFSSSVPVQQIRIQPEENIISAPNTGNTQNTNITENITSDERTAADQTDGDNLIIQIQRPTTAAVPNTTQAAAGTTSSPAVSSAAAATSSVRPSNPAAPASASSSSSSASSAASPSTRTVTDYWVQTGAFSAKVRAEDARDRLASSGIVALVENREIDGSLWYRVRLGPYTSENEANYWLALVQTIDGFGDSQVRVTTRQQ